jgi:hypothetical protein
MHCRWRVQLAGAEGKLFLQTGRQVLVRRRSGGIASSASDLSAVSRGITS